jgi:hypothetical protein
MALLSTSAMALDLDLEYVALQQNHRAADFEHADASCDGILDWGTAQEYLDCMFEVLNPHPNQPES